MKHLRSYIWEEGSVGQAVTLKEVKQVKPLYFFHQTGIWKNVVHNHQKSCAVPCSQPECKKLVILKYIFQVNSPLFPCSHLFMTWCQHSD